MIFNKHSELEGRHALLGASKYHWINYGPDKLVSVYRNSLNNIRGTELHALAHQLVRMKVHLPPSNETLNRYVNDAIGFKMQTEVPLYYSENCFGTPDAICCWDEFLRVHDLKTGEIPGHMEQLEIYVALFCLEYNRDPKKLKIELRIYQNGDIVAHIPDPDRIQRIMDRVVEFDMIIKNIKAEEEVQ